MFLCETVLKRRSIQSYAKFSRFSELGEGFSFVVNILDRQIAFSPSHKSCEFSPRRRSPLASELHLTNPLVRRDT